MEAKSLNEMAKLFFENAKAHGFHEKNNDVATWCSNLHGEISELWEAYRRDKLDKQCDKPIPLTFAEEELADIIIRAAEISAQLGIDIEKAIAIKHEYNVNRPFKHGGKLA